MKYKAICDVCGFEYFNFELIHRWDGLMVCKEDFEVRHPQDFLRAVKEDSQTVPWTRPEPADVFTDVTYIDTGNNDIPDGTFNQGL